MPTIKTTFGQVNKIPSTCKFEEKWINIDYKSYPVLFCPIESEDGRRKYALLKPSLKYSNRCDSCAESFGYCNYEYELLFGLSNIELYWPQWSGGLKLIAALFAFIRFDRVTVA